MSQPFARARAMMAQIAIVMKLASHLRPDALADIGTYRSRGKGRGRQQASANTTAQQKRASVKACNRAKHRRLA